MQTAFNVAVVGVTGAVGETFVNVLQQRRFPIKNFYPVASARSVGKSVRLNEQDYAVMDLANFDFSQVDIAFFSAGSEISAQYAPLAAEQGCVVIDNTSQFRYDPAIALVVPEVNPEVLADFRTNLIIANPNCSTIQLVVAIKPIHAAVGITDLQIVTYQAVSGAGQRAVDELATQTAELLNGQTPEIAAFPKQIAFNVLPQIGTFQDNHFTYEEMKMVWETHKILNDSDISVNPTAVRVPVFYGHSEAVHLQTRQPISADEVKALLANAPGVCLIDDGDYPTAVTEAADNDAVFVGRIRNHLNNPCGINLWIVADNVRKGAALNAVQIAELLIENYW